MTDPQESDTFCARLVLRADDVIEARSARVPASVAAAEQLVSPEDHEPVRTLLARGQGTCRVVPTLEGWPAAAEVRVETLEAEDGARRLVTLTALPTRSLSLEKMVSVVAHEVKNPLAGISGALEVVRLRSAEGSNEAKILGAAHARVKSLDRTLEDLLLLTKPIVVERSRVDLVHTVQAAAQTAATALGCAAPQLELGDEPRWIDADPNLFARAIGYLVHHAMQEDPRDSCIQLGEVLGGLSLQWHYGGGDLERSIKDRIFDPTFLERSRRTGLDLPVAARIIRAHGGDLGLELGADRVTLSASLPHLRRDPSEP